MNHRRRKAKHQRAGCLFCKPHKDERQKKLPRWSDKIRMIDEDYEDEIVRRKGAQ